MCPTADARTRSRAPATDAGPTVTRRCAQCGYSRTYRTAGLADYHHSRHSCTRHQQAERAANQRRARHESGPVRDCQHTRVQHQHGTRSAYVADHCRCPECRKANAEAARIRYRDIAYGTWQPHIDAAPSRHRIQELRTAGLGVGQISTVSGVSRSIIKGLLYGYSRTHSGPAQKIRPTDAAKILAINPDDDHRHPASHTDATGTRRRLQALVALGYPEHQLAALLQRPLSTITAMLQASKVTVRTARTINELYRQLVSATPPILVPERRAQALHVRARAARNGWLPPHAWDNIDTDTNTVATPEPDMAPDPIAIERALFGDLIRLTPTEQAEVVHRLTAQGLSIRQIAERLRTSTRTVSRRREQIPA